jgi:hypothetical protein
MRSFSFQDLDIDSDFKTLMCSFSFQHIDV